MPSGRVPVRPLPDRHRFRERLARRGIRPGEARDAGNDNTDFGHPTCVPVVLRLQKRGVGRRPRLRLDLCVPVQALLWLRRTEMCLGQNTERSRRELPGAPNRVRCTCELTCGEHGKCSAGASSTAMPLSKENQLEAAWESPAAILDIIDNPGFIAHVYRRNEANALPRIEILRMLPAPSYEHIDKILNEESFIFEHGLAEGLPLKTLTVGFIVFDQNFDREPIRDLINNLDTLDLHTGTDMHFFLCGVSKFGKNEKRAKYIGQIKGAKCYHNARAAHSFIKAFQREIPGWNYNLGLELVLIDIHEHDHKRRLNFKSAVYLKIDEMIKIGMIERPSELLDKLTRLVQEGKAASAADFRSELTAVSRRNWLKGVLMAMFPNHIQTLAQGEAVLYGGTATPN